MLDEIRVMLKYLKGSDLVEERKSASHRGMLEVPPMIAHGLGLLMFDTCRDCSGNRESGERLKAIRSAAARGFPVFVDGGNGRYTKLMREWGLSWAEKEEHADCTEALLAGS